MEIKSLLVKDIKYAPYNPRRISEEVLSKLKRSIEEFGYVEPIVVNKRTMHVVGGNQRLKVLRQLGIEEVQAVIVDLDDTHEKALNIALNKINGEWDLGKLKEIFEELEQNIEMINLTGFDPEEVEKITEHAVREIEELDVNPFFEEKIIVLLERDHVYLSEAEFEIFKKFILQYGSTIEEGIMEIVKNVSN